MPYDKQRKTDPLVGFQFELDTGNAVTGYFAESAVSARRAKWPSRR